MSDDDLSHHGVKGMKWGVRKDYEPVGRKSKTPLTPLDKKVLDAVGMSLADSPSMRVKYGPGSLSKDPPTMEEEARRFNLTPGQKKVLIAGGIAVLAFGGAYALGKHVENAQLAKFEEMFNPRALGVPGASKKANTAIDNFFAAYGIRERDWSSDNLSTTPIHIPLGSLVKRVSTEKESIIRPGGFYAAFMDEDVERYKAVLPVFWKRWGVMKDSGGYVVHLRAKQDVRAPSPRKTFEMFQSMISGMSNEELGLARALMRQNPDQMFAAAAAGWNNENDPLTKRFFELLRREGYQAVPDLNDAGKLAKLPMRFIDGSLFEVAHHEPLSWDEIISAQEQLSAVLHAFFYGGLLMSDITRDEALAHFGVKGMRWGVRNAYVDRKRRQLQPFKRVAEGTGNKLDKFAVTQQLSLLEIGQGKGAQGAAQKRVEREEAYLNRLETGQAKTTDMLKMYGSISVVDLARSRKRVA